MARSFFALESKYGPSAVYNDCNRPDVHVFRTKRERDAWVNADESHRGPCSAQESRKHRSDDWHTFTCEDGTRWHLGMYWHGIL